MLSAGCSDQFVLEEINIESSDELLNKYRYDIPVITIDGVESFIHRVTPQQFREKILNRKKPFQG